MAFLHNSTVIAAIPVPAPLIYIPAHVIQSQLVRLLFSNQVSSTAAVITIPGNISHGIPSTPGTPFTLHSPRSRIFPFDLRRMWLRQTNRLGLRLLQVLNSYPGLHNYFTSRFTRTSSSISNRSGAERWTPMPCSISNRTSCSPFIRAIGVLSG
jgi:hypothetical protein